MEDNINAKNQIHNNNKFVVYHKNGVAMVSEIVKIMTMRVVAVQIY
jgi:hypothetical protein